MKETIVKLYSNPNFPIILFSTIGVLIVLLIITLIFAIKDSKKRSAQEAVEDNKEQNMEQPTIELTSNQQNNEIEEKEKGVTINIPSNIDSSMFEDIKFDAPSTLDNNDSSNFEPSSSFDDNNAVISNDFDLPITKENSLESPENKEIVDNIYPKYQDISLPEIQNELPKMNEQVEEPVKVVGETPVINVKSLNDIAPEEYSIK